MTYSEEIAERIIRAGFVRPLLQEAAECAQANEDYDSGIAYWLGVVMSLNFRGQFPKRPDYDEVAAIILDCLEAPAFA